MNPIGAYICDKDKLTAEMVHYKAVHSSFTTMLKDRLISAPKKYSSSNPEDSDIKKYIDNIFDEVKKIRKLYQLLEY